MEEQKTRNDLTSQIAGILAKYVGNALVLGALRPSPSATKSAIIAVLKCVKTALQILDWILFIIK